MSLGVCNGNYPNIVNPLNVKDTKGKSPEPRLLNLWIGGHMSKALWIALDNSKCPFYPGNKLKTASSRLPAAIRNKTPATVL